MDKYTRADLFMENKNKKNKLNEAKDYDDFIYKGFLIRYNPMWKGWQIGGKGHPEGGANDLFKTEDDVMDFIDMSNARGEFKESRQYMQELSELDNLWDSLSEDFKDWIESKYNVAKLKYKDLVDIVDIYGNRFGFNESKK